jgi:hypothetical protein
MPPALMTSDLPCDLCARQTAYAVTLEVVWRLALTDVTWRAVASTFQGERTLTRQRQACPARVPAIITKKFRSLAGQPAWALALRAEARWRELRDFLGARALWLRRRRPSIASPIEAEVDHQVAARFAHRLSCGLRLHPQHWPADSYSMGSSAQSRCRLPDPPGLRFSDYPRAPGA